MVVALAQPRLPGMLPARLVRSDGRAVLDRLADNHDTAEWVETYDHDGVKTLSVSLGVMTWVGWSADAQPGGRLGHPHALSLMDALVALNRAGWWASSSYHVLCATKWCRRSGFSQTCELLAGASPRARALCAAYDGPDGERVRLQLHANGCAFVDDVQAGSAILTSLARACAWMSAFAPGA